MSFPTNTRPDFSFRHPTYLTAKMQLNSETTSIEVEARITSSLFYSVARPSVFRRLGRPIHDDVPNGGRYGHVLLHRGSDPFWHKVLCDETAPAEFMLGTRTMHALSLPENVPVQSDSVTPDNCRFLSYPE